MRVAYVCADPGVPVFGSKGSSVHVQGIIGAMIRRGCSVELYAASLGAEARGELQSLCVHTMSPVAATSGGPRERALIARNEELTSLLSESGALDLIYERYSLWSHAAIDESANRSIPSVLEVNAPLIDEQEKHRGLVHRDEAERIARRVFGGANVIVTVSEEVAAWVASLGRKERVLVVPNGVSPARFTPVDPALPGNGFTIGFLGTLKPWHGVPLLLDVFERFSRSHSDARLLVVGDGPEREWLQNETRERGLQDRVTLTGAVSPERVPSMLASMDVTVAPYAEREDFYFSPLKVVESMAAGVPVIGTAVGQIPTLIEHGVDGILTRADAGTMVDELEALFADDSGRRAMGAAARRKALAHFTWDAALDRILSTLESATERNEHARG